MNIERFLFYCRIAPRYKGYQCLKYAIQIISEIEDMYYITKDIYSQIAEKFNTSTTVVEHNIHTIANKLFRDHKDILKALFGYDLTKCPSNSQLIDTLTFAYRETFKNPELLYNLLDDVNVCSVFPNFDKMV